MTGLQATGAAADAQRALPRAERHHLRLIVNGALWPEPLALRLATSFSK